MNNNTENVFLLSKWKHESGLLPTRVVMWKSKVGDYVTHLEVDNNNKLSFVYGHYNLAYNEALTDFISRVKRLNLESSN